MGGINPELVKRARSALAAVMLKDGFVTEQDIKAAQGGAMPPGGMMPPGGGMPMDPAMMGGAMPPMDPAMMGGAMPPMPPMPPAPPAPPAPPGPVTAMPPAGGGGESVQVSLEDLLALFQEIAAQGSGGAPNEGESSVGMGQRLDALESKLDDLKSMLEALTGGGAPPAEGAGVAGAGDMGAMPPLDPLPPGLEGALGAGGGGGEMGAPMSPDMAAGQAMPMVPGGGMTAEASDGDGMEKRSKAFQVSELVAKLRR